jgi:hypothetical protein
MCLLDAIKLFYARHRVHLGQSARNIHLILHLLLLLLPLLLNKQVHWSLDFTRQQVSRAAAIPLVVFLFFMVTLIDF